MMYSVPHYTQKDVLQLHAFIKANPFGLLIGVDSQQKPVATQVPFLFNLVEEQLFLQAHIMRNTDHHLALQQQEEALVVFTGPHTYVSASWYANPQQASTWNYMSVHARGKIRFLQQADLLQLLDQLTTTFENNPNSPASYQSMPEEYIHRLSKAIVAFEIQVQSLEGIFKLSQNKDQASYENIIIQLAKGDEAAKSISQEMEKRKHQLFNHD